MNKKGIISFFLKEGIMLSPELLERINENNKEEILRELKGENKEEGEKKEERNERGRGVSVEDVLKYYRKKYEIMSNILLKKLDAVSINKGKKIFSKTSIIGRVKERTTKGFIIEDVTGETEVITDNRTVSIGDVIGLKGWFKENGFFPEEIIWPDIPLSNKGNIPNILLTRKLTDRVREEGGKGFIIINLDSQTKMNENPFWLFTQNKEKKTSVLVLKPPKKIEHQMVANFLKRRELPHEKEVGSYITYLLEEIPDVLWLVDNKENWSKNYKGVLVVSTDEESFFEYKEGKGGRFGKI